MTDISEGPGDRYTYFVAYTILRPRQTIIGNMEVFRDQPITTFAQVNDVGAAIAATLRMGTEPTDKVIITNWILLSGPAVGSAQ